jgi:hypothetical protein
MVMSEPLSPPPPPPPSKTPEEEEEDEVEEKEGSYCDTLLNLFNSDLGLVTEVDGFPSGRGGGGR